MKEIAEQLRRVLEAHGPRSVGLYYGTGACFNGLSYGMARTWLAGTGSPEHYSSFRVDQSAKWVSLSRIGQFATGEPYIDDVDVMLIAGVNPIVSADGVRFNSPPQVLGWETKMAYCLDPDGLAIEVLQPGSSCSTCWQPGRNERRLRPDMIAQE
jgi:hypothetical protein